MNRARTRIYGTPEFRFYAILDGTTKLSFDRSTPSWPPHSDLRPTLIPMYFLNH